VKMFAILSTKLRSYLNIRDVTLRLFLHVWQNATCWPFVVRSTN